MFFNVEIDWDQLREEAWQRQYEEELARLQAAYQKAAAAGDKDRMDKLAKAMDDI
ncbi:hypothetical protein [Paenibacillus jiagnxiensis]|uniref:hypothetical protein n=1 Tax=Paenibacillus jiagnxiensis TaxID=3228926 RepID=UPI0033A18B46